MAFVSAGLSSYPAARATNRLAGSARGPLFGFNLCIVMGW